MNIKSLRICIAVFLTTVLLCPSFGMLNTSTKIIGNARADYVDASNNTSCIEEDPLVQGWSEDVALTNDTVDSNHPSVAIDSKNNYHVVWGDQTGSWGAWYTKSIDRGKTWSEKTLIAGVDKCAGAPRIAIGENDMIFVVYPLYIDNNFDICYKKSVDYGVTWLPLGDGFRITNCSGHSTAPSICIREGNIHLVWIDQRDGNQEIYYKKSLDEGATWSDDQRITYTSNASTLPSLALDLNDIPHVVWQEKKDGGYELCYARSNDEGKTWELFTLVNASNDYREPIIATDSFNNLHIVWTDNRHRATGWMDVCYKKSADGGNTWTEEIDISGHTVPNTSMPNGRSLMPSIISDANNNLYVVWKCSNFSYEEGILNRTSNDIYLRESRSNGENWSEIVRVTHAVEGDRIYPKLAIDNNGFLCIVWGDGRNTLGDKEIYYKRSLTSVSEPPIIISSFLNQTTSKPSNSITVSGNAVYNDFVVPNANVSIKIVETGEEWNTTTDSNGDYSKTITAPDIPGNYTVRVTITSESHTGYKQMRLAVEETGTTNGGTTNGGQQPGDGKNKYGNLNYILGIVAVIAICIITGVTMVKRRKKTVKNRITIRCPKCRQTFTVEVKPKPFGVKCPYCGKEGTIK